MRLPDHFLIATSLSTMVIASSAIGLSLLGRSAPPDYNFAGPAIEEVVFLSSSEDEGEQVTPLSAETVMLNQVFVFGNP